MVRYFLDTHITSRHSNIRWPLQGTLYVYSIIAISSIIIGCKNAERLDKLLLYTINIKCIVSIDYVLYVCGLP